ncbi:hypothetical protein G5714_002774 [Onychostoma macrolepis]|uniref:Uncharacterized protein n=1 Tax=Onychostoma macrolepis TaxID=369639 RepID=A0A7J6D8D7_9TELE|nr:hypothetical protein G5714_002774 [Onychostoma macrolepis]
MMEGGNRHKYFTVMLQEATRNSRVVVDVQHHHMFESAEKDRSPIRLCGVGFSPSRQKKGEMDIVVNVSTTLTCVRKLKFAFDVYTHDIVQHWTVQQIINDPREYQRVNVTVKVVQLVEDRQGMTRSNQRLQRRSYDVADQTCSLSLTVWGGDVLEIGKWYTIKNASVRQFDGYTCLSTTSQSSLTIVLDVSITVAQPVDNFTVKEGEIVTADVKVSTMCSILQNCKSEV